MGSSVTCSTETKKPPWRAVFSGTSELALLVPGNSLMRGLLPKFLSSLAALLREPQEISSHMSCYRWPLPMAIYRIRADCEACVCCRVWCRGRAERGNLTYCPSVRPRITAAHDSQPWGIATVERVAPQHHLKNARRLAPRGRPKAVQQGRDVSLERVRGDRPQADHISR